MLPFRSLTSDAFFSTDADCNSDDVKQAVAADFDNFLHESAANSPCFGICDVGGEQVDCQPEDRRRRKRSDHNLMTICFTIEGVNESALNQTTALISNSIANNEFHPGGGITAEPVSDDNGNEVVRREEVLECPGEGRVLTTDNNLCGMLCSLASRLGLNVYFEYSQGIRSVRTPMSGNKTIGGNGARLESQKFQSPIRLT